MKQSNCAMSLYEYGGEYSGFSRNQIMECFPVQLSHFQVNRDRDSQRHLQAHLMQPDSQYICKVHSMQQDSQYICKYIQCSRIHNTSASAFNAAGFTTAQGWRQHRMCIQCRRTQNSPGLEASQADVEYAYNGVLFHL